MCGITGYISFPSIHPSMDALSSALAELRHRGPDDSGLFQNHTYGIGLAHTRLSILDLSPSGHQPMVSDDGQVVLVFNGEIYNFRELRIELEAQGHTFRGHSDTEVLLNFYLAQRQLENGITTMLQRLNGIFAFALWDTDRQAMLIVRDAFGVKPLYYATSNNTFAFASEIKALRYLLPSYHENVGKIDVASINRYLSFLWCPGEGTPTKGVRKLNPGEALWVQEGKIVERFTWYHLPAFRIESPSFLTQAEAIHGTEYYLRQATHRQMVADVPIGAFLSGGLDSSSIVAFAREQNPNIHCFTIEAAGSGEEGISDDLPYARRVANYLNVPLETIRIDATRMAEDLSAMVAQLDEPLADPAPLNVLYICQRAREQGVKVLLSGLGGDDLFTGYRRHRALITERYWTWLPRPMRLELERITSTFNQRQVLGRRLRKLFNGASLDNDERLVNYFRWIGRNDLTALYTPEFQAVLGSSKAETPMLDFLAELPVNTHPLERMLALEQRFFLTDHNIAYTDKMSMAAGVEVRVPFLDLDLVGFTAKIPPPFQTT
mgnify:FL=1